MKMIFKVTRFSLLDDDFMSKVFEDKKCAEVFITNYS